MILPFKGNFRLTQEWGNKLIIGGIDIYGQFGLKGHNGVDWATPSGTSIYAPHAGKILERAYDANGYGEYVKIQSDKEGSILAHFQRKYVVQVGQEVAEGQLIGYSNNTGFSTGAHLHWGYYPIPRNRNNGYSGTIDQLPLLQGGSMPSEDEISLPKKKFEELVGKSSKYDEFNAIGYGSAAEVKHDLQERDNSIKQLKEDIGVEKDRAEEARKAYNDLLALVAKALDTQQEENQVKVALEKVSLQLDELDDLRRNFASLQLSSEKEKEELRAEIAHLQALLDNEGDLDKYKLTELLENIISRLTRVLKLSK